MLRFALERLASNCLRETITIFRTKKLAVASNRRRDIYHLRNLRKLRRVALDEIYWLFRFRLIYQRRIWRCSLFPLGQGTQVRSGLRMS